MWRLMTGRAWVALGLALATVLVVAGLLLGADGEPVVTSTAVGRGVHSVTTGGDYVWLAGSAPPGVVRVDPASGRTVGKPVELDAPAGGIAVGEGYAWVGSTAGSFVTQLNARSGDIVDRIRVGPTPQSIALGFGSVWVAALDAGTLVRLDVRTGRRVAAPVDLEHRFPSAVETGGGAVWVADVVDDVVVRLDATSGETTAEARVGTSPLDLEFGEDRLWVLNFGDGTVMSIAPGIGQVVGSRVFVGPEPAGIAVGEDHVWVTVPSKGEVVQIDPQNKEIVRRIRVGDSPQGIAVGFGSVWVAGQENGRVTRIVP